MIDGESWVGREAIAALGRAVALVLLSIVLTGSAAEAASLARRCRVACREEIAACVDGGGTRRACRQELLRSCKQSGESVCESSADGVSEARKPQGTPNVAAPTGVIATAESSSSIRLTWDDISSAETSQVVERTTNPTLGFLVVATLGRNVETWLDTALSSGTTYFYRIRVFGRRGAVSPYSDVVTATTASNGDLTPPGVPAGLAGSANGCSGVILSWNTSTDTGGSGLEGYNVYRNTLFLKHVPSPATTTADSGLPESTSFSYQVSALDNAGNESARSAPITAGTLPCATTTTTSSSTSTSRPPTTSTSSSSTSTSSTTSTSRPSTTTTSSSTSTSRPPTTSTSTSSTTSSSSSTSRPSTTSSSTTTSSTTSTVPADTTPPSVPTGLNASASSCSQMNLAWNPSVDSGGTGLAAYRVYRNTAFLKQVNAPATSTSDATVAPSTAYTYQVSALDAAGNESGRSTGVAANTPACPTGPPALVGFVPGVGTARGVAVAGGLAVVGSDPFGGSAVNVANQATPAVLGSADEPFIGQHAALRGTRGVVGGQTTAGQARLWVLNLGVPTRPVVQGELPTTITVGNGTGFQKIVLDGSGTLAVAAMGTAGLWTIDLSNAAAPRLLGSLDTSGIAWGVALNATGTTAYVADGLSGFKVINIANPAAPALAGTTAPLGTNYRDVAVSGTTAFAVNQNGTFDAFDVSLPSTPRRIGSRTLSGFGLKVAVEGALAAVIAATSTADVLDVLDIGTPATPVLLRTGTIGATGTAQGIDLEGGFAYVPSNGLGLRIYDVQVMNAPLEGAVDDDFMGQSIAVVGTKVVSVGTWLPTSKVRLRVLDVSTPSAPQVRGDLTTNVTPGITGVAMNATGTLAAVALGGAGLWAVDVSNASAPRLLGSLDTAGVAYNVALNATASIAFVADGLGGLRVVSLANPAAPSLMASLAPAGVNYRDIALLGTLAFMANQNGTLDVLDVSIPTAPRRIGTRTVSGFALKVAVEGTLATVITGTSTADQMDVVDVSNPAVPAVLRTLSLGSVGLGQGITLANRLAYVAANGSGLRIYDLANASNPVLRDSIDTVGTANDVAVQGTYAYVADFPATVSIVGW